MDSNVNVCTLVTSTLWALGALGVTLISGGFLDARHSALTVLFLATGSVLYVRRVVRAQRRREDRAFEMGRLAGPPESGKKFRAL